MYHFSETLLLYYNIIVFCQVLLNGVSYCKRFPGLRNSIKVVGLAGGRVYNIFVEVFHKSQNREVLESNILVSY